MRTATGSACGPARSYRYRRQTRARREATADQEAATEQEDTAGRDAPPAGDENDTASDHSCGDGDGSAMGPAGLARAVRRTLHPAALSREERHAVLQELCSDRFCDLPPAQVFTTLLDKGRYLCSVRTMYRILEDHGLSGERRRGGHQSPSRYPVPIVHARHPNEAWTWDVTQLRGPATGVLYYLYTILDIFSRKVVGWTLATGESEHIARQLIKATLEREGVPEGQLTLHADRGGPMISGSVHELLDSLNVRKSHNPPRVSNDNPYGEE